MDKATVHMEAAQDKAFRRLHWLMLSVVLNIALTILLVGALLTPVIR